MKTQNQKKQKQLKQKRRQEQQNLSPNLLSDIPTDLISTNKFLTRASLVLQFIFLVVIALNVFQNISLDNYSKKANLAEEALSEKFEVFDKVRTLNSKISIYKNVTSSKVNFSPRIKSILDSSVQGMTLVDLKLDKTFSKITLTSDTALKVALVITNLSNQPNVSEIILQGATLDGRSRVFNVELMVLYK